MLEKIWEKSFFNFLFVQKYLKGFLFSSSSALVVVVVAASPLSPTDAFIDPDLLPTPHLG
jgi:hypothetical protein